jgi:hypothetical protein
MDAIATINNPVTVAREELYRQVWQEPMTKLAPKYGLSDVGLAKVCRKHDIPRPPVGYWAKVEVGQVVEPTPLPELDDEALQEICFFRQHFDGAARTGDEDIIVEVAERLSKPHTLVAQFRDAFATTPPAHKTAAARLDAHVSRSSLQRALRIWDAAIKKWEELGGLVRVDRDFNGMSKTCFAFEQDVVGVTMTEESQIDADRSGEHRHWRETKRTFTGRLVLEISGRWADDFRRRWADGKKQRLENVLGSFLLGVKKWIAHQKACRLDDECEARQRKRVEDVRQERQQRHEQMEQRRTNLEACAENWRKSQEIRSYLAALEATIESGTLRAVAPAHFPEWLSWAKWYADFIDPLTPTPTREEYIKPPMNVPSRELDLMRRTRSLVNAICVEDADALFRLDHKAVRAASDRYAWSAWSEIGRVLEGLGYDVSKRERGF